MGIEISLELADKTFPAPKEDSGDLTVTATVLVDGVETDVDAVRLELLHCPLQANAAPGAQSGLMETIGTLKNDTSEETGVYQTTLPASLFTNPGTYRIRAKAELTGGTNTIQDPLRVLASGTTESEDLVVVDTGGADEFNVLTDAEKEAIANLAETGEVTFDDISPMTTRYDMIVQGENGAERIPANTQQNHQFLKSIGNGDDTTEMGWSILVPGHVQGFRGYGATGSRPAEPANGEMWFDTTLGFPIWWSGTEWVDATGAAADAPPGP